MAAPTLRGTSSGTSTSGNPVTVNMPVGTAEGDVCLLMVMSNSLADRLFTEQSGTWTKLLDLYVNGTTDDINLAFFRKVQGASPDASVTVQIDAGTSGLAAILRVYDGADLQDPEDVPIVTVTGTGAADPDPGAITPITPDAMVIAWAAVSDADVVTNFPAGYANGQNLVHQTNISLMACDKVVATPAAEDPAAFTDPVLAAGDSRVAITYALRPAPVVSPSVPGIALLGVMRGSPLITPPAQSFLLFDEFRYGDISEFGFIDLLVVYESAMVAPGDQDTDPPDPVFLDNYFASLKAANPNVNRIVLDYEAWDITLNATATGINMTVVGYYVTLIEAAKTYFSDVGFYGEIPERYTGFLTGGSANAQRLADWQSRQVMMQEMWDLADTIWPSFYFINPVDDNEALRDQWYAENLAVCQARAPNKRVYPFMWPRIHSSVDPTIPDVPGPYWRSSLESLLSLGYDGFAGWAQAGDTDPRIRNPVPDFWLETVDFASTVT